MQCYDTDCFNTPQTPQQWHVLRARVKMLDIHVVSLLVGVILKDMGVYFGIDRTRQHNRGCWVLVQVVERSARGNINFLFLAWAVHVHLSEINSLYVYLQRVKHLYGTCSYLLPEKKEEKINKPSNDKRSVFR